MLKHVKEETEFDSVIKEGKVLVDFYADWCGPCKMVAPIVEKLAGEYEDMNFLKINVDEAPRLAARFEVYSIPTLLLFENGKLTNKQVGYVPEPRLKAFIGK